MTNNLYNDIPKHARECAIKTRMIYFDSLDGKKNSKNSDRKDGRVARGSGKASSGRLRDDLEGFTSNLIIDGGNKKPLPKLKTSKNVPFNIGGYQVYPTNSITPTNTFIHNKKYSKENSQSKINFLGNCQNNSNNSVSSFAEMEPQTQEVKNTIIINNNYNYSTCNANNDNQVNVNKVSDTNNTNMNNVTNFNTMNTVNTVNTVKTINSEYSNNIESNENIKTDEAIDGNEVPEEILPSNTAIVRIQEGLNRLEQKEKEVVNRYDKKDKDEKNERTDTMKTCSTIKFPMKKKKKIKSFDFKISKNPQIPHEYMSDIFNNLVKEEAIYKVDQNYMKKQSDINEKMRAILIDWIIDVHLKFKLLTETLFLTVNLVDRYLSLKTIQRNKLQLLGVAALMIASKYEEIYAPDVRDFVYITDDAFTKEEILQMELEILLDLDFNVTTPTSNIFFEYLAQYFELLERDVCLGRYFLEIFLLDNRMNKYPPSLICCTAGYMVMKVRKYNNYHDVYKFTSLGETELKECVKDICFLVNNIASSSFQAVRIKFGTKEMYEASKIKF